MAGAPWAGPPCAGPGSVRCRGRWRRPGAGLRSTGRRRSPRLRERHQVDEAGRPVDGGVVVVAAPGSTGDFASGPDCGLGDGFGEEDFRPRVAAVLVLVDPVLELGARVAVTGFGGLGEGFDTVVEAECLSSLRRGSRDQRQEGEGNRLDHDLLIAPRREPPLGIAVAATGGVASHTAAPTSLRHSGPPPHNLMAIEGWVGKSRSSNLSGTALRACAAGRCWSAEAPTARPMGSLRWDVESVCSGCG